ncbi:MAG: hypothetical protein ABS896_09350 [Carnobacterium inhibens]|uniref:hypothetical protein n=1 Tax=Carnobacterium inhibens TaxID=147709 RepID=UPI003314E7BF
MKTPFTKEELKIMRKHNVPEIVAYNRVHFQKWAMERALTEKLNYSKNRRKERQTDK